MDSETGQHDRRPTTGGGRAFHSRLEPFVGFIRDQQRLRKTWKEIAGLLGSEKGCTITFQGLHQFYRRFVQRAVKPHWEDQPVASVPSPRPQAAQVPPAPSQSTFRRPDRKTFDPDQFL
jgi:hypothetical protein